MQRLDGVEWHFFSIFNKKDTKFIKKWKKFNVLINSNTNNYLLQTNTTNSF
jgi:hypothetical protein